MGELPNFQNPAVTDRREAVVLLHGLFFRGPIMRPMAARMRSAGYDTRIFSYPTLRRSPCENARALRRLVESIDAPAVHFIAHSLGGLILRHYFAVFPEHRPGRVVTLGTPHSHSQAARVFAGYRFGKGVLRKSIEQGLLGDAPAWNPGAELGSIAGTYPVGLGRMLAGFAGANDGTVGVEETRLEGMADHVCIEVSHFGLMFAPAAIEQSLCFLRHGHFRHD